MKAVVWSKPSCSLCEQAKSLLKMKGIPFEVKMLGSEYTTEDLLAVVPSAKSVPQIFLDNKHVGGFTELKAKLSNAS